MVVTCWDSNKKETYEITVAIGGAFCGHKIVSTQLTTKDFQALRCLRTSDVEDKRLASWFRHMATRNDYAV